MPRIDFELCDRLYILKLICTAQMTYSSFITLIYGYLMLLQSWTTSESARSDVMTSKWSVIVVSVLDFGVGILLAFASNMRGIRCGRGLVAWITLQTFLIPVSIFLIMQLYYKIIYSKMQFETDVHYSRINIAQVCFLMCQYVFMAYVLDFLVYTRPKPKAYDPNIRPETVNAPTDLQITTTESRHVRFCPSFLSQSSKSESKVWNEKQNFAKPSTCKNENQISENERTEEWWKENDDYDYDEDIYSEETDNEKFKNKTEKD